MPPLPWRRIIAFSAVGTALTVAGTLADVHRFGNNPLELIQPARNGPAARAVHHDFPDADLPDGIGHDGQQFYAIARQPMHPNAAARDLDRPRYRLQRLLFPWLSWALHPSGGGVGLIRAMFVVGALAIFAGAVATGALASLSGGPEWLALAFAVLPGTYAALRLSTADNVALAAALAALALSLRGRHTLALVAAVAAVLAKEPVFLVIFGFALWRRDRAGWLLAGSALVAAAAVAVWLRAAVPAHGRQVVEFGAPFVGLADSARRWAKGKDHVAALVVPVSAVAGVFAVLRRGLDTPFGWALALHVVLVIVATLNVIGLDYNATRATNPLLVLTLLALTAKSTFPRAAPATS